MDERDHYLDRVDWPEVGDEVLYNQYGRGWIPATVLDVAHHDGDLKLDTGQGEPLAALDSKHGSHVHGWLLYREAAQNGTEQALGATGAPSRVSPDVREGEGL